MKIKRKLLVLMLTAVMVLGISLSCMPSMNRVEAASAPSLKKKSVQLIVGDSQTIKVKGKRIISVTYKSSKKEIAKVSKKGKITAKKAGKCSIQVTVKYKQSKKSKKIYKKKLKCKVEVFSVGDDYGEIIGGGGILPEGADETFEKSFVNQTADTAISLLKSQVGNDKENVLISPESIITAMMLSGNGAAGSTLEEFENTFCGTMSMDAYEKELSSFQKYLESSKNVQFHEANSIWVRDDKDMLEMKESFAQKNKELFDAEVRLEPFDTDTLIKINQWVSDQTKGMIPSILNGIDEEDAMFLINALAFEGEWESQYKDGAVQEGQIFTNADGTTSKATMLYRNQHSYLQDGKAKGFVNYYKGGKYAFVAILPNENVTVEEYLSEMTGKSFLEFYHSRKGYNGEVRTKLPEFSYDYTAELSSTLKTMGLTSAFDPKVADFSEMATTKDKTLYIDQVLHKTHIELDRYGTKAAAATAVIMAAGTAMPTEPPMEIYLDRPFIYAIVENTSGLPVFIGTVQGL